MSMNIINSLPTPMPEKGVTQSEKTGAFHRILDEKKDEIAQNTDKEDGDHMKSTKKGQADKILLPSETLDALEKDRLAEDKKADSKEKNDLVAWLMAIEETSPFPEKRSFGFSAFMEGDTSLETVLNFDDTPILVDETVLDRKIITSFSGRSVDLLSFDNDNMTVFKIKNEPTFDVTNPISALSETQTLLTYPHSVTTLTETAHLSPSITLNAPISSPQWQELFSQQIVFFNRNDIHKAELRLHPEELGSLHIQLEMQDGKMQMILAAQHSVVKGVLESAIPHLRTSLAEQGIDLKNVQVNDSMSMAFNQESSSQFHRPNFSHVGVPESSDDLPEMTLSEEKTVAPGTSGVSVFA